MCIRMTIRAIIAAFIVFCINSAAFSEENVYSEITVNPKIIETLDVLKNQDNFSRNVLNIILGNNLSHKPMKIMFYDLGAMGYQYEKMDAVSCKRKNSDRIYILINTIHENAPAEALASLLSHETIHQDDESSIEEETTGWTNEAKFWISYNSENQDLKYINCDLVKRLNTLTEMYVSSGYNSYKINKSIRANVGYVGLPETSPGYGVIKKAAL